jgi:hypothetical protein
MGFTNQNTFDPGFPEYYLNAMKKLREIIRGSRVPHIKITYGEEILKFNLFDELKVSEEMLTRELKEQASYYGYLFLLHKKLLTRFEYLKQEKRRIESELFIKYKTGGNTTTGRAPSDDTAKAMVRKNKEYLKANHDCIKARDDADTIYACVRGFEQRKDLLQTLSSNNRKNI